MKKAVGKSRKKRASQEECWNINGYKGKTEEKRFSIYKSENRSREYTLNKSARLAKLIEERAGREKPGTRKDRPFFQRRKTAHAVKKTINNRKEFYSIASPHRKRRKPKTKLLLNQSDNEFIY